LENPQQLHRTFFEILISDHELFRKSGDPELRFLKNPKHRDWAFLKIAGTLVRTFSGILSTLTVSFSGKRTSLDNLRLKK